MTLQLLAGSGPEKSASPEVSGVNLWVCAPSHSQFIPRQQLCSHSQLHQHSLYLRAILLLGLLLYFRTIT